MTEVAKASFMCHKNDFCAFILWISLIHEQIIQVGFVNWINQFIKKNIHFDTFIVL